MKLGQAIAPKLIVLGVLLVAAALAFGLAQSFTRPVPRCRPARSVSDKAT